MCGIVGYVGQQEAAPILLDGLRRLEYRGYDSAGIAVCGDGQLRVKKSRGRPVWKNQNAGHQRGRLSELPHGKDKKKRK